MLRKILLWVGWFFFSITKIFIYLTKKRGEERLAAIERFLLEHGGLAGKLSLDKYKLSMVSGITKISKTLVREVMVPRVEMVTVNAGDSFERAVDVISEGGKSRIPVVDREIDNIVGIVYAKDVLVAISDKRGTAGRQVDELMRKVHFVPETKNVYDLLKELRKEKVHVAIVIDEFGGTAGLVTLEDLIEEIVGEIRDEYEEEVARDITQEEENAWRINARVPVEDLNEQLELELPKSEDYNTIGGFICTRLGRIPKEKEKIELEGLKIKITRADEKAVEEVRIEKSDKL